ncbi:MAG TPA: DUF72 domain-containing protein [Lapillicoccus sp.]|nr:DUF72 domain-containing protein [Lapillicoccus sp.]
MGNGRVRVGISGWTYASWRGDFYPTGLPHTRELAYAADRMSSVEVNGSFYSLQRPTSYARWRDSTPDDFVFAVKGSRFITHMKRLVDIDVALANFWASGVLALGPKLGPVLWQLPARTRFDGPRLADFFDRLPRSTSEAAGLARGHDEKVPENRALVDAVDERTVHHVLEARHASFATEEAADLLRANDIGTVWADAAGKFPVIDADTSGVRYVRLHGHTELYASGYSSRSLDQWADRCRTWAEAGRDVYVYFDNDMRGRAPWDAVGLLRRLGS